MSKISSLFIFLLLASTLFAQKHDNLWMHIFPGQDTIGSSPLDPPYPTIFLDFNTSPPNMTYKSTPYIGFVAKLTMCDSMGKSLFFSNGYNIFHIDGPLMENGDNLAPIIFQEDYPLGYPGDMSMMGLPRPGYKGDYYVLQLYTDPNWTSTPKLLLSLVRGATAPELGAVEYKNKVLFEGHNRIDFFNITKHANGRDWWIVFSDIDIEAQTRTFYSYFLSADTVYLAQNQIIDGYEPVPEYPWQVSTYQRVFSPDGKYFISLDLIHGIRVHTFDRCTGLFGPLLTLPYQLGHWGIGGIAISPNSQFLYVSDTEFIFQYDLTAPDIAATKDTVGVYDGYLNPPAGEPTVFGLCHLGPDGKIYFFNYGQKWVHYIAKPNRKGDACKVIQRAFEMPVSAEGLPYYPNYRLGPLDGSACDTLGLNNEPLADFWWFSDSTLTVEFSDNSSYEPSGWHWDFGDGAISQDTSPVHTFPAAGTYNVCLTVSNQYAADTVCKEVTVGINATTAPKDNQINIEVFPNPTTGMIFWTGTGGRPVAIRVYNQMGQLVLERFSSENFLDLSSLPAGVYRLQFLVNGGKNQVIKSVVLQR